MSIKLLISAIIALAWFLLGYFFAKIYFLRSIRRHRADAIKKSRSVTRWFNTEKLAPFMDKFPYTAREMVFIGKWIDYLVFKWLSRGSVDEIILLEIKSGQSRQNKNEKLIEAAVKSKRVRYEIWRK